MGLTGSSNAQREANRDQSQYQCKRSAHPSIQRSVLENAEAITALSQCPWTNSGLIIRPKPPNSPYSTGFFLSHPPGKEEVDTRQQRLVRRHSELSVSSYQIDLYRFFFTSA